MIILGQNMGITNAHCAKQGGNDHGLNSLLDFHSDTFSLHIHAMCLDTLYCTQLLLPLSRHPPEYQNNTQKLSPRLSLGGGRAAQCAVPSREIAASMSNASSRVNGLGGEASRLEGGVTK